MRKKTRHLTMFLIKDSVQDYNEALKEPAILCRYDFKTELPFEGALYLRLPRNKNPWWVDFVQSGISNQIDKFENVSTAAVIFIKAESRIFALAFGYGRHLLKLDSFEIDFGLRVALNTIDPNRLRSIDVRVFQDLVLNTSRQVSRSTSLETFGLDVSRDVLRAVTGEPRDPTFADRITGGDALAITTKVEFSELHKKCKKALSAFRSRRYKERFGWIDHIKVVRDFSLVEELDGKILQAFRAREFERIFLAPPEIVDWSQIRGFRYSRDEQEDLHSDLFIEDYVNTLEDLSTLTIQELKQKNIEVFESSQDEPLKEWSIYECITFEIEHKKKIYVLTDGRWFEIARNFAEEIRSYLSELPVSSLDLPGADKEESEEAYNSNAAAERRENIVLMDRRLVQAGDARGKIEVCDLLTDSGEFVHIKRRTSSSKLSHLFAQGMVSAEEFLRDAHFRTRIREILRDLEPDLTHLIPEERPRPENYEIVYGVIAEQSDIWPLSLPFFSQLHLMQAARYLKTLGFKVSTLQIGWE